MTDYFPPSFMNPDALEEVIEWLRALPIDHVDKKRELLTWASIVGVHLTGEQVLAALPELLSDEARS